VDDKIGDEAVPVGALAERLGIRLTRTEVDLLVATMPVSGNTQPHGLLHGGASAVLAETLGSIGAHLHATAAGGTAVGLDLNITHHHAVRRGSITATARPVHLGRTLACYEVSGVDDAGRRVFSARITCLLREPAPVTG
jgi:1,4-dihydroxy-2-naphthoyl-CoA hydrolase